MGWRYTDDPSPSPSTAAPNPGGWRYTDAALMRGKTSALGAFASGAADGLTLGFGDEASSAVRTSSVSLTSLSARWQPRRASST